MKILKSRKIEHIFFQIKQQLREKIIFFHFQSVDFQLICGFK